MDLSSSFRIGAVVVAVVAVACCVPAASAAEPTEPTVRLDPTTGTIEAVDLDPALLGRLSGLTEDDWRQIFPVYTGSELPAGADKPAVAGAWTVEEGVVRFHPRFPLIPGLDYAARLDVSRLRSLALGVDHDEAPIEALLALPGRVAESSTVVSQVYPTTGEVPENLLRFYVHFSAAMGRGEAYEHIYLFDDTGDRLEGAFLDVGDELWDPGMRRLTVFFDPGRIKRGLRPHLEAGAPLTKGKTYRLVINPAWRDGAGQPLAKLFDKTFTAVEPDREMLDPADWEIVPPVAGSQSPLELRFPKPLDHGLLQRVVQVLDAGGTGLPGRVEIGDEERVFRFVPSEPWRTGEHTIEVEAILEDLAGNNLKQVFDVDLTAPPRPAREARDTIGLPFTVDPL